MRIYRFGGGKVEVIYFCTAKSEKPETWGKELSPGVEPTKE